MAENLISRLTKVHKNESRAVLLSALYFFFLLSGYYILRPLREEMGLAGGVRNLHWLFRATLVGTLLLTPLFGALVSRFPRRVFLPISYRFFMLNLLLFFVALKLLPERYDLYIGRVFYVWLSVFNMFVLSLFWAFMADVWGLSQSKRLFGFIAVGGSLGAIVGAAITANLVDVVGRVNLILISIALLECAVQCARLLGKADQAKIQAAGVELEASLPRVTAAVPRAEDATAPRADGTAVPRADGAATPSARDAATLDPGKVAEPAADPDVPTGGSFLEGITLTLKSPYLRGISLYLFLYSLMSTFLYFEQANIIADSVSDRDERAAIFANIDLWVNIITLASQLFLTSRLLPRLGVGLTLALLPALTVVGFLALGAAPILPVLVVFQVLRRAGNYAFIRPARETLYTILGRAEKYKAKSFIDTFVYRGGDALGESTFDVLTRLGMGLAGIAYTAVPIAILWGGVGIYLGNKQQRLADEQKRRAAGAPDPSPQAA